MNPVDVDVEDVLQDVVNVLHERETGRTQTYHSEVREIEDVIYLMPGAWQSITNSLTSLDQSLAPLAAAFTAGEEEAPRPGFVQAIKNTIKRIIQKSVYWYVNPIVAQLHSMHSSTARAMHEVADQLKSVNDRLEVLEKDTLSSRVLALEGERFDERIGRLERSWRQRAAEPAPGPQPVVAAQPAVVAPEADRGVGRDRAGAKAEPLFHFDYYWFESIHRGDRALIKRRQQPYLEYFEGCSKVLDVGCGRGEFLELMAEKGIGGYGIDIEADSVQYCVDSGLQAVEAEALAHLASIEDESIDGVFISQVAEHMTPGELIELVGLAYARMEPGGFVVVETPNPQCLLIFASFFYADLSHVQPIHPETMRFLLLSAGFRDVEIKLTNPVPKNQRLGKIVVQELPSGETWVNELNQNVDKLNSVLFSYMDYAAVARK
ncbi:MAG: class I SAM-dependent methyltransferase [Candidatus Geothermincolia bacterium]